MLFSETRVLQVQFYKVAMFAAACKVLPMKRRIPLPRHAYCQLKWTEHFQMVAFKNSFYKDIPNMKLFMSINVL